MKYLYLTLLLGIYHKTFSQGDPLYAQYLNNPLVINPAYTGLNNNFNASVSYRKQWSNFDGSPTTFNVSMHSSVSRNKMGLGILLVQDKTGVNKNTEAYTTYAYRLKLNTMQLSFGIQAGFINFRTNNDALNAYDPSDPAFSNNLNITKLSFGAGIILSSEQFFAGLSVPRMLRSTIVLSDDNTNESVKAELYDQHYYGTLSYMFYLSPRVRFKPSCLVKYIPGAPVSVDYTAAINLDQKYSAGLFTRNANTFGFLVQLRFASAYRFGYVFEVPTGNSVGTRFNTHEVTLGLNLAVFGFQTTTLSNF
ncbi:MAG TPA: type IX secretion system membrane protein PorP/SprF [Ohtaekwangia sp.]|uniref:PorP/SprF family type IX secretion system membrane protein n=1 Tax=Ohtaekwangia sp. TaxID=2066019 RepID=UPI002F93D4CB